MSILVFGTVLDTVAAFAFHIMYTLGNTSQITQCGRHNHLQGFRGSKWRTEEGLSYFIIRQHSSTTLITLSL